MAYNFRSNEHQPTSEEEARAKFAYFRNAEASIDLGPLVEDWKPVLPLRKRSATSSCGTHSGYIRHQRNHTKPCRDCLNARAVYQREYRAKQKATA